MALTRTDRLFEQSSASFGTGAYTSTAFTPSNNSLLVVRIGVQTNAGSAEPSASITVSGGGWTYTSQINNGSATFWARGFAVFTAPVGTGASMQLSIDCDTVDVYQYWVHVVDYTDYDTSTPVGGKVSKVPTVTNGAESITLDATPASTSEVLAWLQADSSDGTGVTVGTGWTEIQESTNVGDGIQQVQIRTGSTSTTVGWDDVYTGPGTVIEIGMAAALEIKAAAAGGSVALSGSAMTSGIGSSSPGISVDL